MASSGEVSLATTGRSPGNVDLGDQNVTLVAQPPAFGNGFATANFDNSYEIIRAGLNFRFNH